MVASTRGSGRKAIAGRGLRTRDNMGAEYRIGDRAGKVLSQGDMGEGR